MAAPHTHDLDIQGDWDSARLRASWPEGLATAYYMGRLERVPVEATLLGASGRILEVAAAEAVHACRLAQRGLECHVVEPSETMLDKARRRMVEFGVQLHWVRGIAETLPYPDHTFDRVLIDAAIDHLAAPDVGVREMLRVLKPDGRFIVSFVNYAGLSKHVSRAVYAIMRRFDPSLRETHLFWDSPVPVEHTFEATYRNIGELCGQYMELDRTIGVSMLWGTPGWGSFLRWFSHRNGVWVVSGVDRIARAMPVLADYVLMVWRPRAPGDRPGDGLRRLPTLARVGAARPRAPLRRLETMRASPWDPVYRNRAAMERELERTGSYATVSAERLRASVPWANRELTGDARRSAVDELAAYGPFARTLLVGIDGEEAAETWLGATGAGGLDVIEMDSPRLPALRRRLAPHGTRVRCAQQDLNFLSLAPRTYNAILVTSAVSRVINLEFFFDEVAQALAAGGILGVHCYSGERRQLYHSTRLALVNQVLQQIPVRFRFHDARDIEPADPSECYARPFRAIRSDEIVAVAKARFDVVEERYGGRLFPLFAHIDVPALEREAPEILESILQRERALAADPSVTPCTAFLVLRGRGATASLRLAKVGASSRWDG